MAEFIEVTHNHYENKVYIERNTVQSVQKRYDPATGEARTLIIYGANGRGNYIKETVDQVMAMLDTTIIKPSTEEERS